MDLKTNSTEIGSWSYDFNLPTSIKIKDISQDTELWQIGLDRLNEFTDVAHRMYNRLAHEDGGNISRTIFHAEHQEWLPHSVLFAPIRGGEIVGTGAAIRMQEMGGAIFAPLLYRKTFNLMELIRRFDPVSLWVGTRNSVDATRFPSKTTALKAMQAAVSTGYDILAHEPGHLSLSLISEHMLRRVRRLGYNWRLLSEEPIPHPLFKRTKFLRAYMDTREAWVQ